MTLLFTPPLFDGFKDRIRSLPQYPSYGRYHLCTPEFQLFADASLTMYYAPFDAINESAAVTIVGITPGWQQMEIAFRAARAALVRGDSGREACTDAKLQASFAGQMRLNLLSMLTDIGLHHGLGLPSPASLFGDCAHLLHTTSAIRYPVFVGEANYTGHAPQLLRHACPRHDFRSACSRIGRCAERIDNSARKMRR